MNGHEFIELYHAALFGAGIINPLNIRFSAAELAYVLHDSGSSVIFTDPVFATLVERARDEEGAKIDKLVVIGGTGQDVDQSGETTIAYEDLIAAGEPVMPPEPEEDDPVILMYTGGTTGLPKGALLDQRAEVLNVYHVGLRIGLPEEPSLSLPVTHVPRRRRGRGSRASQPAGRRRCQSRCSIPSLSSTPSSRSGSTPR